MIRREPIVTILVPVYGVEKYIEQCVRSLMEQSYEGCRYIFVDDCSPDRSVEILRRVVADYPYREEHVRILSHSENRGLGAARNTLFDSVEEGEYVINVDSDDWVSHTFVEGLVTRAIVTQADAVRCGRMEVDERGVEHAELLAWLSTAQATRRAILGQSHLITCNIHGVMVRRELLDRFHIRVAPTIDMAEDYTYTSQVLFHAERIANLNEPLYYYRTQREGSYMEAMATTRHTESYIRANVWVTQYIESQGGGERYHYDLAVGKVNLKKWIAKRGGNPRSYDDVIFGDRRKEWLRPLHLRLYNRIVDINIILLTRLTAALVTLPLVVRVAWTKFRIKTAIKRVQIWGS